MATWINHLRIAEHFMMKNANLDNISFLVGNIGPDCGIPNKDHSTFTPDKSITHWMGESKTIDADSFMRTYLKDKKEYDPFYLGYYVHLITDIEWIKFFDLKKKESLYAEGFQNDPNFIWTVKKDWYGQDCIYLKQHKDCVYYTKFKKIREFPNVYFDFYPEDAFVRQIGYIKKFYLIMTQEKRSNFLYLTQEENDSFVKRVIASLEQMNILT